MSQDLRGNKLDKGGEGVVCTKAYPWEGAGGSTGTAKGPVG